MLGKRRPRRERSGVSGLQGRQAPQAAPGRQPGGEVAAGEIAHFVHQPQDGLLGEKGEIFQTEFFLNLNPVDMKGRFAQLHHLRYFLSGITFANKPK